MVVLCSNAVQVGNFAASDKRMGRVTCGQRSGDFAERQIRDVPSIAINLHEQR
jgi:hypothetical protein